nr:MAG TPA: hypothetical protein [Caudoviricetes sp.]
MADGRDNVKSSGSFFTRRIFIFRMDPYVIVSVVIYDRYSYTVLL